jgi:hypothetical protein
MIFNIRAEILVLLMSLQIFLSQTVFNFAQESIEIILIITFALLLLEKGIPARWFFLFFLFITAQTLSLFLNDVSFNGFMLNTKEYGLALLSIAYFKDNSERSYLLYALFIACITLFLYQKFISISFPIDLSNIHKNLSIFNQISRPLGVFLDFHTSSFFAATFLIGLSIRHKLFLLDVLIIWIVGVKTQFLAIIGQKLVTIFLKLSYLFSLYWVQVTGLFFSIFVILVYFYPLFLELADISDMSRGSSLEIMISLITNLNVYTSTLEILPRDLDVFNETTRFYVYDSSGNIIRNSINELMLVDLFVSNGIIIGSIIFFLLTKDFPSFRIFIILTMFHYSNILSPLIIYMMFFFENLGVLKNGD